MACQFSIKRRVEFSETDAAGIMHFSNFFKFMESAEHAFFRSLGHSVILPEYQGRLSLPRVHAACDFTRPLRFEDEVEVRLLVEKKTSRSLTYRFRLFNISGPAPEEAARGRFTVVCTRKSKNGTLKATHLPKKISNKIEPAPPELLAFDQPNQPG
jgi:YbgC/YbaW family acyl-CoA thioester hydrolase